MPVFILALRLSGRASSAFTLALGVTSIAGRYAIGALVSSAVFVGAVGVWYRHVASPHKHPSGSGPDLGLDLPSVDDGGEGCLIVIAVLAAALLPSGIFWFVGGYALLFEVAFEAAFAGTMVYRMGKRDTLGNWAGTLVRRTWLPALVIAGILVALGAKIQHDYPEAQTLSPAIKAHRSMQK